VPLKVVSEVLDDEDMVELRNEIVHHIEMFPHFTADSIMREIEDSYPDLDLIPVIKAIMSQQKEA